jgi:preprotein translocase subunit SecF
MKRTLLVTVIVGVLVVSSLFIWPNGNAAWGEDQPEGQATQADAGEDPEGYISEELDKLGLDTGEIQSFGDDRYLVDIEKFDSRSEAFTTTGKFRPCSLKVKLEKGKVQLERCGLEDAGLIPNTKQFPSSLKIEEGDIWGRPQ